MFHIKKLQGVRLSLLVVISFTGSALGVEQKPYQKKEAVRTNAQVRRIKSHQQKRPTKKVQGKLGNSLTAGKTEEVIEPSALSLRLKDRLSITTGVGFFILQKGGESWRSGGASDLRANYRAKQRLLNRETWATLRYNPVDVAPLLKGNGETMEQFQGVILFLLGGGYVVFPMKQFNLHATFELGVAAQAMAPAYKESGGAQVVIGCEGAWPITETFSITPALRLGTGAFQTVQLQVAASLLF